MKVNDAIKSFARNKKLRKKPTKYNLADPVQRKRWWIKRVTYLARVWFDRDVEYRLREGLINGDPSAKRLADALWKKKSDIEAIVERKVNEYTKSKESYRQKLRDRRE
jgi:hypothetical protein|tara:strand:- start:1451 stop:1774 length:324 start_codon:yes stop_codon:yes gene_type:complete